MNQDQTSKLELHDEVLFGRDGELGVAQKVKIMWRVKIYFWCALSSILGYMIKWGVDMWTTTTINATKHL